MLPLKHFSAGGGSLQQAIKCNEPQSREDSTGASAAECACDVGRGQAGQA